MAHKKGGGATSQKKDSAGRRLGIKKNGQEFVKAGNIICRQRGTKWHPDKNVGIGKDHTIFALIDGIVKFFKRGRSQKVYISVLDTNSLDKESEKSKKNKGKKSTVKKSISTKKNTKKEKVVE